MLKVDHMSEANRVLRVRVEKVYEPEFGREELFLTGSFIYILFFVVF